VSEVKIYGAPRTGTNHLFWLLKFNTKTEPLLDTPTHRNGAVEDDGYIRLLTMRYPLAAYVSRTRRRFGDNPWDKMSVEGMFWFCLYWRRMYDHWVKHCDMVVSHERVVASPKSAVLDIATRFDMGLREEFFVDVAGKLSVNGTDGDASPIYSNAPYDPRWDDLEFLEAHVPRDVMDEYNKYIDNAKWGYSR